MMTTYTTESREFTLPLSIRVTWRNPVRGNVRITLKSEDGGLWQGGYAFDQRTGCHLYAQIERAIAKIGRKFSFGNQPEFTQEYLQTYREALANGNKDDVCVGLHGPPNGSGCLAPDATRVLP